MYLIFMIFILRRLSACDDAYLTQFVPCLASCTFPPAPASWLHLLALSDRMHAVVQLSHKTNTRPYFLSTSQKSLPKKF